MKKILLSSLMMLSLTACQKASSQLVGEWQVDQQAMRSDKSLLNIAPPAGVLIRDWKTNMTKGWSFLFRSDRGMEVIMNGSHYQGRYKVTQEIGQTVYIRAELRPLAANRLDELLQVSQDVSKVEVKHFSFQVLGDSGTLKLDDFTPLKLKRQSI
jgi:hypothetical protein